MQLLWHLRGWLRCGTEALCVSSGQNCGIEGCLHAEVQHVLSGSLSQVGWGLPEFARVPCGTEYTALRHGILCKGGGVAPCGWAVPASVGKQWVRR